MRPSGELYGSKVQSLSTKFFYKGQKMCFLIAIHYGVEDTILYKEFESYQMYRQNHDELIYAINSNGLIPNDFASI